MSDPIQAPRGVPDILPPDSELLSEIEDAARVLFERYGYRRIETPLIEYTDVFVRSAGEASDIVVNKELYTFEDRSGRSLSLRPEGTAGAARAVIQHELHKTLPLPIRLAYWGPMFRYEAPQANRSRQFIQFGVECYGSAAPAVDAEVMTWGTDFYASIGLSPELLVNSIGCGADRERYAVYLRQVLHRMGPICKDCHARLQTNPLRVLDCKEPACRAAFNELEPIRAFLCEACASHYGQVTELLDAAGVKWTQADMLVRGLDYYTGTVFEFDVPSLGSRSIVGAGGRYDKLIEQLGGPELPAAGMSPGIVATMNAVKAVREPKGWAPDVYVAWLDNEQAGLAVRVAHDLRSAGVSVVAAEEPRSLKAQMRAAHRLGAATIVILGPKDVARGVATVRNLQAQSQDEVPLDGLVAALAPASGDN